MEPGGGAMNLFSSDYVTGAWGKSYETYLFGCDHDTGAWGRAMRLTCLTVTVILEPGGRDMRLTCLAVTMIVEPEGGAISLNCLTVAMILREEQWDSPVPLWLWYWSLGVKHSPWCSVLARLEKPTGKGHSNTLLQCHIHLKIKSAINKLTLLKS